MVGLRHLLTVLVGVGLIAYGMAAEAACPNNCNGWGDCSDGVCQCYAGKAGPDCSIAAFVYGDSTFFWGTAYTLGAIEALSAVFCVVVLIFIGLLPFTVRQLAVIFVLIGSLINVVYYFVDPLAANDIFPPFLRFFLACLADTFIVSSIACMFVFWLEIIAASSVEAGKLRKTWPILVLIILALFGVSIAASVTREFDGYMIFYIIYLTLFSILFTAAGLFIRHKLKRISSSTSARRLTNLAVGAGSLMFVLAILVLVWYILIRTSITAHTYVAFNFVTRLFSSLLGIIVAFAISPFSLLKHTKSKVVIYDTKGALPSVAALPSMIEDEAPAEVASTPNAVDSEAVDVELN